MRKVFIDPGIPDFFWDADTNTLYVPPGVPVGSGGGSPDYEVKSADFTAADGGAYIIDTNDVRIELPGPGTMSDRFDVAVEYGVTGVVVVIPFTASPDATLDPSKRNAGSSTLSNGNLTFESSVAWSSCLSVVGNTSGKWQVELDPGTGGDCFLGISTDDGPGSYSRYLGQNGSAADSVGYWGAGQVYYDLAAGSGNIGVATYASTDVVDMLVDLVSSPQTVALRKNGVTVATVNLTAGQTWYFGVSGANNTQMTIKTVLTYPEAGFDSWALVTFDTKINGGEEDADLDGCRHYSFTYLSSNTGWLKDPF